MNSKILIIYEYQILFEILNEIQESLNFQVIQSNQDDYNKIRLDPKINYLILSKNKISNFSNNLILENIPIKIETNITILTSRSLPNQTCAAATYNGNLIHINPWKNEYLS